MVIHFKDRDNKYMCNKSSKVINENITEDKKKITCKFCKRKLKMREWGGKAKMKTKLTLMIAIFILLTLSFNFVNAEVFTFDNVKSYDSLTRTATIKNTFGLGETYADIQLITPNNMIVPRGYQKVAEFKVSGYVDYKDFINELEFYNLREKNNKISRTYDLKLKTLESVLVDDYKTTCISFGNCEIIKTGTHEEIREVWTKLTPADLKKNEVLYIGIFTEVKPNDYVDWIPSFMGVKVEEWATWTESLSVDLKAYYKLDETSGQAIDSLGLYNSTQNYGSQGQTGKINTAYNYNPIKDNYTNFTTNYGLGKETATLNAWVYITNNSLKGGILYIGNGAKDGFGFGVGSGTFGTLGNELLGIYQLIAYHDTNYNLGTGWVMITMRLNESGGSEYFVNATSVFNSTSANMTTPTNWSTIGAIIDVNNLGFGGKVDEVGIWNRKLTNSEITQLYNSGLGLPYGFSIVPAVTLNSPVNYFNTSVPLITFNVSVTDTQKVENVSLYIDGIIETTNTSNFNGTYIFSKVLMSGIHNWSILAWNNQSGYNQSETRIINLTILSPTINLFTPDGVNNYNTTSVRFNASVTDNLYVQNVTLYIDALANETNTSHFNGTYIFDRYLSEGTHNWSIYAYDNESNPSQSSTISFYVDLTNPLITIVYPTNTTYYTPWTNESSLNVTLLWNSYDTHLSLCWYSLNGGANTILACNNNLTTSVNYGSSINFTACANDSVYNIGCSSRTANYKYKIFEINQTYNNPVLENTPQNYYANVYLDSSLSVNSVYFTYDGVNYSASYSEIGNYTRLEKTSFYTPGVTSNANKTLTWWALLNDSSIINLSSKLQQVNNLVYSTTCNATYPYYIFNLTLKDEKTQLNINGTIETYLVIKTSNGTNILFNWTSFNSNTSAYLCSNLPISSGNNYIVEGTIKYYSSNENYSAMVEYYNFLNFSYNNNTYYQNVSLYDINITEGTEFQLTFKDSSYRARENILIYVYRQYLPEGTFKVVELPKTDSNGQTIVHLVRNDVVYNLIAVDSSGNVLGTLNNVLAFCNDYTIGDCKINFQGTTSETELENYLDSLGLTYTLDFDDTTNLISFIFSSTTSDSKNVRLEVISSAVVTNRTICNTSLDAIAGTLTCDVSAIVNSSSNVNVKIYLDNEEVINENLSLDTSNWNVPGVIFFGFLLILLMGIMFIESKEGIVIVVILGLIVLISLGVVKGKIIGFTSGILWLIIVGVILLIKLNKENKQ